MRYLNAFIFAICLVFCGSLLGCSGGGGGGGNNGGNSLPIVTGTISGTISLGLGNPSIRNQTGNFAMNARVWLEERPDLSALTDAAGRYVIADVPTGNFRVVARLLQGDTEFKMRSAITAVNADEHQAVDVTIFEAKNRITGILRDANGNLLLPGTRLRLWGEEFEIGQGGRFTTPPLPELDFDAVINDVVVNFGQPDEFRVPIAFVPSEQAVEVELTIPGSADAASRFPIVTLWGMVGDKLVSEVLPGTEVIVSAKVFPGDSAESAIIWSVNGGTLSNSVIINGDLRQKIWQAPASGGMATISISLTSSGQIAKASLPMRVKGLNTYNVVYNGNGNTGGHAPTDSKAYGPGEAVSLKENTGNLVRTGYLFAGWNTRADGAGIDYELGGTFQIGNENVVLYAKWLVAAVSSSVALSGTLSENGAGIFADALGVRIENVPSNFTTSFNLAVRDIAGKSVTYRVSDLAIDRGSDFVVLRSMDFGAGELEAFSEIDFSNPLPVGAVLKLYSFDNPGTYLEIIDIVEGSQNHRGAATKNVLAIRPDLQSDRLQRCNFDDDAVVRSDDIAFLIAWYQSGKPDSITQTLLSRAYQLYPSMQEWYSAVRVPDNLIDDLNGDGQMTSADIVLLISWYQTMKTNDPETIVSRALQLFPGIPSIGGAYIIRFPEETLDSGNIVDFGQTLSDFNTFNLQVRISNVSDSYTNSCTVFRKADGLPILLERAENQGFDGLTLSVKSLEFFEIAGFRSLVFGETLPYDVKVCIYNNDLERTVACWPFNAFSVSYDGNGHTGGSASEEIEFYPEGTMITVKSNTGNLVRSGYTFGGWNTRADGKGVTYEEGANLQLGTENLTLFALWIQVARYTVTYHGNSHTGGSVPFDTNSYGENAVVTVAGNTGNLVRTGYSFAGWNTQVDGAGTNYSTAGTFNIASANVVLYARWIPIAGEIEIDLGGGVKMQLVLVHSGSFIMGSPTDESGRNNNEGPQHQVSLTKGFYMGKFEVTQAQWLKMMSSWPDTVPSSQYGLGDTHPAYYISWFDAVRFCNALSSAQGLTPVYTFSDSTVSWNSSANGYRLPTEAEWEYAARAKTNTAYYWGATGNQDYAWIESNSSWKSQPVGNKLPNAHGLYDISGNVFEWCWDWYGADYYSTSQITDPAGPTTGTGRINRGGCCYYPWNYSRSSFRNWSNPSSRTYFTGMRVVRNLQ